MTKAEGEVNEYLVRGVARTDGWFGEDPKLASLRLENERLSLENEWLNKVCKDLHIYATNLSVEYDQLVIQNIVADLFCLVLFLFSFE
jgi:hypothetical protein